MFDTEDNQTDTMIAVELAPESDVQEARRSRTSTKPKQEPNYHVIIWNDEEHTYEYVIDLLTTVFKHSEHKALLITIEVDKVGRGIAWTCHKELAELKLEQVMGFGADPRMPKESNGSIRCTIEPAPE